MAWMATNRDGRSGDLFGEPAPRTPTTGPRTRPDAPLAERVRPRTLDEIVGQEGALGPDKPLRRSIEDDALPSLILWGPPGSGKTTLAHVIRQRTRAHFVAMSAVLSGVKEVREALQEASSRRQRLG
jgi:putative ATPase